MDSIWKQTVSLPHFPALKGDIQTQVLIIGGGLAGLLCAHYLKQAGVDCVIAEQGRICGGTTGGTTAKVTAQHGFFCAKMRRQLGSETAKLYLQANLNAVAAYRRLCRGIPCDFTEESSFAYSLEDRAAVEEELRALQELGVPARLTEQLPLPIRTAGAVCFPGQARLHPLKLAAALAKGLTIYEHTPVLRWDGRRALCETGVIRADKAIIATHFPFQNLRGGYFVKLYQQRHYVLALEDVPPLQGMYVDGSGNGLSFRQAGSLLLLGGGAHRTGKPGGGWQELRRFAAAHYPGSKEVCRWAAQDCVSLDTVPYIGPFTAGSSHTLAASGFGGWGMTGAMTAALLLTDRILGIDNPFAPVFSPQRSIWHRQLARNLLESAGHLLLPKIPRCTHMGCSLQWNAAERSWDCACHGSRFGEGGQVLENPAGKNLPRPPGRP